MWRKFITGISSVCQGMGDFYETPALWKYAVIPFGILVLLYGATIWGGIVLGQSLKNLMQNAMTDWPQWLSSLLGDMPMFFIVGVTILLIPLTIGALYEMFGGMFFDPLIASYAKLRYHLTPIQKTMRFEVIFILQSCLYSINTLWLMGLAFLFCHFIPVVGQIVFILLSSYRLGVAYLFAAGYFYGHSVPETKAFASKNLCMTLGYGVACYFLLQIPLAILFTLPGLILSSMILFSQWKETAIHPLSVQ